MPSILIQIVKAIFTALAGSIVKKKLEGPATKQLGVKVVALDSGFDKAKEEEAQRKKIVNFMHRTIGRRYKLGVEVKPGEELAAEDWDCSEVSEAAYRDAGLKLPDGSQFQYAACQPVKTPKPGDLGFLWNEKWGRIGHVLVYVGNGQVIHAVAGRGVVLDQAIRWEKIDRWKGWRRHVDLSRPIEDRA